MPSESMSACPALLFAGQLSTLSATPSESISGAWFTPPPPLLDDPATPEPETELPPQADKTATAART